MEESKNDKKIFIEYNVPFEQSAEIDGDFTIKGIAINETTTSNGHTFLGEELEKSAKTLIGVPLLKDHINSVDNIVGRVNSAHFNKNTKNIPFQAIVKNETTIKMIRDKLINSVSVGAHVDPKNIEEGEDGNLIPRGIVFKELSLVAVPADSGATFGIALNNALDLYKSNSTSVVKSNLNERGSMNMTEEETQTEETKTEEPKPETKPEPKPEEKSPTEEEVVEEKLKKVKLELKKKELSLLEKRLSEADNDEDEEESEEESEKEAVEEKATNILQNGTAFTYQRKSYIYN